MWLLIGFVVPNMRISHHTQFLSDLFICHNVIMKILIQYLVDPLKEQCLENSRNLPLVGTTTLQGVMGVKISLALQGMYEVITPPIERQQQLWESFSKVSEWESTLGWTPSEYWTSINLALKHAI
jgi:hypothetical protein